MNLAKSGTWLNLACVLVVATILYNLAEAVIALWSGAQAESVALMGFGWDSLIEVSASGVLLWRLMHEFAGADACILEGQERFARRFIGGTFLALACYLVVQSGSDLWLLRAPEKSFIGIILAVLSMAIMPLLAMGKIRAANQIGSEALRLEAQESMCCFWLSVILLAGLAANAYLGWWWADPAGALLMVPWLVREGMEAVRGESCGCHD